MCEPISASTAILAAGAAASAAGGYLNSQNQASYAKAQNKANQDAAALSRRASEAERDRQAKLTQEAQGVWEAQLGGAGAAQQDAGADAATAQALATARQVRQAAPLTAFAPQGDNAQAGTQPLVVGTGDTARQDSESAAGRAQAAALARLAGYGVQDQAAARSRRQANDQLAALNNYKRGSLAVSDAERSIPAASVSPGDSSLATLLSAAGTLATMYGAYSAVPTGAAGATVSGGGLSPSPGKVPMFGGLK